MPDISTLKYIDDAERFINITILSIKMLGKDEAVAQSTLGIFYAMPPHIGHGSGKTAWMRAIKNRPQIVRWRRRGGIDFHISEIELPQCQCQVWSELFQQSYDSHVSQAEFQTQHIIEASVNHDNTGCHCERSVAIH